MSASLIYDLAPIGAIVTWSDGTPRPPERHRKRLAAWENRNSKGRLIRKQGKRGIGNVCLAPDFTLHEGDFGANGVITLRIHRTFSLDSSLTFKVIERRSSATSGSSTAPATTLNSSTSPPVANRRRNG